MTVFAGKETKNGREETSRRLDGLPSVCCVCSVLQINTTR